MPINIYGTGDYFHMENSHVIPALIRKAHEGKLANSESITVWGTGNVLREFMHVDDMADACVHIMSLDNETYDSITKPMNSHINFGTGQEMSIRELTEIICDVIGFEGEIVFDIGMPEGVPRKFLDVSRLEKSGWTSKISFRGGMADTYNWFLENLSEIRK
jgi:GDP-L-fucose synthase